MGFHSATFGIVISKHGENTQAIIHLIAKNMVPTNIKGEYVVTLFDDLVPSFPTTVVDGFNTFTLNIDNISDLEFRYKEDKKIKIGTHYCCNYMIHIGEVGDECDKESRHFLDETISQLIKWKQELINSDRIDDEVMLSLVGNCCS